MNWYFAYGSNMNAQRLFEAADTGNEIGEHVHFRWDVLNVRRGDI